MQKIFNVSNNSLTPPCIRITIPVKITELQLKEKICEWL